MTQGAPLLACLACLLTARAGQAQEAPPVTLHVSSPYVVDVEHRDSPQQRWVSLCVNPCDNAVPSAGEYRVLGRGVTSSTPFRLSPQGSSVTLEIKPGSKKKLRAGWFIVSGGAAAVLVGALIDAVGTMEGTVAGEGAAGDSSNTSNARQNFYLGGTILLIAGLATAFFGGSMVFHNQHTGVNENDTPPPSDPPSPTAASAVREKAPETAALDRAPSFFVPVLSATF